MAGNERTIKYWRDISEYDLETARVMLDSGRLIYVGFMCHQSIEKILKAIFVKEVGTTPPYTHNLEKLAVGSGIFLKLSDTQKIFLKELELMNIESRYPDDWNEILKKLTGSKCKEILEKTRKLFQWLKERLKKK